MDVKVSIVIPFYNGEKYINNCIRYLKEQKYGNFEALFVDDGSTDNSELIFNKVEDSRIRYLKIKKSGVSAARNFGIKNSRGKYITFWDIDDHPYNNFLSKFVEIIEKNEVDTVICNYDEIYTDSGLNKKVELPWKNCIINHDEIVNSLIPKMIYPLKNESAIRGLVWRTFTKLEKIKVNKIYFEENVSMAEDLLFTIKLYSKSKNMYVISDSLYGYNHNNNSAMSSFHKNSIEKQIYFHEVFIKLLKSENLYELNKNRYSMNKINMYTVEISNIFRNGHIQVNNYKHELRKLREILCNEQFNYKRLDVQASIKFSCLLLKARCYLLIAVIYLVKEKVRVKKYY